MAMVGYGLMGKESYLGVAVDLGVEEPSQL